MPHTSPITEQLRLAMRGVAATVTLITTATPEGTKHVMPASSFTSVSLEPPTVLVCIGRHTSIHTPLLATRQFCINVLRAQHEALTRTCTTAASNARFAYEGWRYDVDGLPFLADAQAALFCELMQQHVVGTHSVLFARVQKVVRPDTSTAITPLIYLDGRFATAQPSQQTAPS